MKLLPQQQSAIDKLKQYKVGALFMEPGTGKTRTALEFIRSIDGRDNVLWITPFGTKENLRAEIEKQGGLDNLTVVGVETLSASKRVFLDLRELLSESKHAVVVVDESLKVKNAEAIRTQRVFLLCQLAEYRLILNGTPITKNLLDLWAQFQCLSPKILNMPYSRFKNAFCKYERYIDILNGRVSREVITGYRNIDYLYSLIGNYVFECTLDLGVGKKERVREYKLAEKEKSEYNDIKGYYLSLERMFSSGSNIFLAMTQKLQQSYCTAEEKFVELDKIVQRHGEEKVITFVKFVKSGEEVRKRYPSMCVLSYGKHAYGLNLQRYRVTVYFDKTFDYAQMLQSQYRTFRTGQEEDCIYYFLTGDVGVEKMMDCCIRKKESLLSYIKRVGIEQAAKEL